MEGIEVRISVRTGRRSRVTGGPLFWLLAGPIVLAGWMAMLTLQVAVVLSVWLWRGIVLTAVAWWRTNPLGRGINVARRTPVALVDPHARPVDLAALKRRQ